MNDSVTQDLDRYMDRQDQAEAECNQELREAEDLVEDLHITIYSLKNYGFESENNFFRSTVVYNNADDQLTITIDMSEVEGEAFVESLTRKSTSKYVAEKTWIDTKSAYEEG